jgi:hypothetical protein
MYTGLMAKQTVKGKGKKRPEGRGGGGERAGAIRAGMLKELRQAVEEVDEEGLLFLLRQAQVLIHNARVEKLNREGAARKAGSPAAARRAERPAGAVQIEEKGTSIFLTIGEARKVMTRDEMKRLVRICYGAESKSEALRQLYAVLARERNDILFDARIGNAASSLLEALFRAVRSTYTLKDR